MWFVIVPSVALGCPNKAIERAHTNWRCRLIDDELAATMSSRRLSDEIVNSVLVPEIVQNPFSDRRAIASARTDWSSLSSKRLALPGCSSS